MGVDPVTLAIGAAVLQGVTGFAQNEQAASNANKITAYNVAQSKENTAITVGQQQRDLLLKTGTATANAGASGATLGGFDDVMDDNYKQGLLNQAITEYNGKVQRNQIQYQGAQTVQNYHNAAVSSLVKGAGGVANSGIGGGSDSLAGSTAYPSAYYTGSTAGQTAAGNSVRNY